MLKVKYAPPPIDQRFLSRLVLEAYPSHQSCANLIDILVSEYVKLWRLVLNYPKHRVVAPGCLCAVQKVHQSADRLSYFVDSMSYFGRYVSIKDLAWFGPMDIKGTVDTVHAYHDLHKEFPPEPWADMNAIYGQRRNSLDVVDQ